MGRAGLPARQPAAPARARRPGPRLLRPARRRPPLSPRSLPPASRARARSAFASGASGLRRERDGWQTAGETGKVVMVVASVAVLSDIHGVLPALDAVLAEPAV